MKIACVVDTFPRKSELFIQREIDELRREGAEVEVFSVCRPDHIDPQTVYLPPRKIIPSLTCACIFARMFALHPYLFIARTLRSRAAAELARLVFDGKFDTIRAHFLGVASTLGLAASKISGIPLTVFAHARDVFVDGEAVLAKAAHAQTIFTCCQANADELIRIGVPEEKIHVSYHGLPEGFGENIRAGDQKSKTILASGRFVEKKGFRYLIKALEELKRRGADFECVICGDGPLRKDLVESVRLSGLPEAVEFPGWVSQQKMLELYAKAGVVVCPSVVAGDGDRDGIPNVILEAMACGVPVIASNAGGIPEVITDESKGLLVPSADHTALADAIEQFLVSGTIAG
jgi:glycosyltransferase involved in cell wall biosynthesis